MGSGGVLSLGLQLWCGFGRVCALVVLRALMAVLSFVGHRRGWVA